MALLPFNDCSSIMVSGATSSGKTQWVYRLLQNLENLDGMFNTKPEHVLYCYGVWQPIFNDMESMCTLHQGLPNNIENWESESKHKLIILDDLMDKVVCSLDMSLLFTQGCHHRNISVIFITQNLFLQGKYSRTISLNTQYMVLFRSMRDVSQISTLGKQLFPGRAKLLTQVYEDVMKQPYAYLIVDNSPHSNPKYRLRTHIFPGEDPIVYVSKA
jgi:hypothetical protein